MDQTSVCADGYEFAAPDSWDRFSDTVALAYGGYDAASAYQDVLAAVFEPQRSLLAHRGGRTCATLAVYSLDMGVPGGRRPVAGISYVTADPGHRRRGLMRGLMVRTFARLHERGEEPVAALHTTEPAIYGRFGFGSATRAIHLRIPRHARDMTHPYDEPPLPVRVVDPAECVADIARIHQGAPDRRPGAFHRDDAWTRRALLDLPERRGKAGRLLCVLAEDRGESSRPRGYALYSLTARWEDSYPRYDVHVRELFAEDPLAYTSVWRALLDIDLAGAVHADRPVDDPVLALLADPRSAVPVVRDQLYVRVVDLGRALRERGYAAEADVVIEVADTDCPWNQGRWRLRTGVDGGDCARTTAAADLSLSAWELGAVYLGGTSLKQLAAAGRVTEHRAGAVAATTHAFHHDPAPFCPMLF
ncbi:GNAT family N-acetyltransferase [Streptomyces sclerotialus]|uniref:GNAT family N-acetyltransferase n=1 Tax=Streptomyces sclerotialus TaxID=1957 RepID=UPI00068F3EA3